MGALGWIIAIVVVFLFGRNISFKAVSTPIIDNAIPGPQQLPFMTTQNQLNAPHAQPSPWSSVQCDVTSACRPVTPLRSPCNPTPVSARYPLMPQRAQLFSNLVPSPRKSPVMTLQAL